jgi:hypothetical protein
MRKRIVAERAAGSCLGEGRTAGPSPPLPPDFLSNFLALANFMRLSLLKAAHVAAGECSVAGNPGALRSG